MREIVMPLAEGGELTLALPETLMREALARAGAEARRSAGAAEYDSWAAAAEYDSWTRR
ncbi:MAG TPA: hypothetical protein VF211_15795 [Burkholderiales bacterium]